MTKIEKIEEYLYNFFKYNFYEFEDFYRTTYDQRKEGIYQIDNGSSIMDFLNDIHSNIEENLKFPKLIPHRFATPENLLCYLKNFLKYIAENGQTVNELYTTGNSNYLITHTYSFKEKLNSAFEYALQLYDLEYENFLTYQKLRYDLINNDIPNFIENLKSIFSNLSYAIARESEGYYHSNVYLILKLLGFEIIPEETTNIGRIDAVIRFSKKIYILEFKFSENNDDSELAFNQIIEKNYASKFKIENIPIYAIGVSFNSTGRNIRNYKFEKL